MHIKKYSISNLVANYQSYQQPLPYNQIKVKFLIRKNKHHPDNINTLKSTFNS